MTRNFQNVFVIITLCIGLVLISGILLSRYLSNQYFDLRKEFKYDSDNSKYISRQNFVHVSSKITSQNESKHLAEKMTGKGNLPTANLLPPSLEVKKRSKRQTLLDNDDIFFWNFNLNVTRYQNLTSEKITNSASDISHKENLGLSLSAKGKGERRTTFSELQNALRSVELFVKSFFAQNIENGTDRSELNENNLVRLDIGSLTKTSEVNDRSEEESSTQRGRQAKFFGPFEFFRFGGKSLAKSTEMPTDETTIIATKHETDSDTFKKNEVLQSSHITESKFVTEHTPKTLNFHTESLLQSKTTALSLDERSSNSSDLNLVAVTKQDECLDCVTESLSLSNSVSTNERDFSNNITPETIDVRESFTEEILEMFCMGLVKKIEESQQLSGGINVDPEFNESNLTSNISVKAEHPHESGGIEDPLNSKDELVFQAEASKQRQGKFVNIGNIFGFGSGRSAIEDSDEWSNFTSEGLRDLIELENLPSILDCENYFREKQSSKMFPKPNLLDTINDHKIELDDFANVTISPRLKEQQIQFLSGLLVTNLNNTSEEHNRNSEDSVEKSESGKEITVLPGNETINEVFRDKGILLNKPNFSDVDRNDNFMFTSTDGDRETLQATEMQRDGRFVNMFGLGSGSDESIRKERWFLNSVFSSGSGTLETLDSDVESNRNEEFGSGDAFIENISFSDDAPTDATDLLEHNGTISVKQSRFWGVLGFVGSGEGRELTENKESTEINIEIKCERDCNETNTTEQSHACDHHGCRIEGFGTYDNNEQFTDNLKNTSNCDEDCHFPDTENATIECDECNLDAVLYSSAEPIENSSVVPEDNSQTMLQKVHEIDCHDCDHENFIAKQKRTNFSECDDCNVVIDVPIESYELTENYLNVQLNDTKSYENNHNDCDDCDGNYLIEKSDAEKPAFSECDECESNALHSSDESYINSEKIPHNLETKVINQTMPYQSIDCDDCNYNENERNETILNFEKLNRNYRDTTIKGIESSSNIAGTGIDNDFENSKNMDTFTESLETTQTTHNNQTEKIPRRFMETIFLTGSGDGGLFGDGAGLINLIEERSPLILNSSRSKLDDTLHDPSEMPYESNSKRLENQSSVNPSREENIPVSPVLSVRRGRLDDTILDPCDDCETDLLGMTVESSPNEQQQSNNTHGDSSTTKTLNSETVMDEKTPSKNINETIPSSSEIFPNIVLKADVSKSSVISSRFCNSANECNATLNERCMTINRSRVCDCGRAYVRSKETGKCVGKRIVKASMKLPAEKFDEELRNPQSPRYQRMRNNSINMMRLLLKDTPDLWKIISDVDVVEFSAGSLIVRWNLVFALNTESEATFIKDVEVDLQRSLRDEDLIHKASLDIRNASLISVNGEIDPCKSSELNYCSENAYCVLNAAIPGTFACYCKDHYNDVSTNPLYSGETCTAKCPDDYCGTYGHCEIIQNEKYCLCSELYFGRRCEVPGLYLLIILGIISFISITMMLVVVFRKRCTRSSYGGSDEFRRNEEPRAHSHSNDKVSDAIALEENIGTSVSKYMHISTPIPPPLIRITQATINETSLSFEGDSTFEKSPIDEPEEITTTI